MKGGEINESLSSLLLLLEIAVHDLRLLHINFEHLGQVVLELLLGCIDHLFLLIFGQHFGQPRVE